MITIDNVQIHLLSSQEFQERNLVTAYAPNLGPIIRAFQDSAFYTRTKYARFSIFLCVDGYVPGKTDTLFSEAPDINYQSSRDATGTALIVSAKIQRADWFELPATELGALFFQRVFEACYHVCRTFSLDTRALNALIRRLPAAERKKLEDSIKDLGRFTFNRETKKPLNEFEIHLAMAHNGFPTQAELTDYYSLEDQIDEVLQVQNMGYSDGHEFGSGVYTIFCKSYKEPKTTFFALKKSLDYCFKPGTVVILRSKSGCKELIL